MMSYGTPGDNAPVLDYQLDHSVVYSTISYMEFPLTEPAWKNAPVVPARNPWTATKAIIDDYVSRDLGPDPLWLKRINAAHDALAVEDPLVTHADALQPSGNAFQRNRLYQQQSGYRGVQKTQQQPNIATSPLSEVLMGDRDSIISNREMIANKLAKRTSAGDQAFIAVEASRASARPRYMLLAEPEAPKHHLYVAFHLKHATFPANYGAGRTLNTFSLLPGERTTISIRHYARSEDTRAASESVLDSFSQSAADDLADSFEQESQYSTSYSYADQHSKTNSWAAGGGDSSGILVWSSSSGWTASSIDSDWNSVNSNLQQHSACYRNAMNHHVARADAARNIDINTESQQSKTAEDEQVIVRELENINKSRVLNFVFRQLLQGYKTVTWLDDITLVYTNGYPDSRIAMKLSHIDQFLSKICSTAALTPPVTAKTMIQSVLSSIEDYNGIASSFYDMSSDTAYDIGFNPHTVDRMYKKKNFGVHGQVTGTAIKVPGIILDVFDHVVNTPAMIVDSLLGAGEALDCYNSSLQSEAVDAAHLQNQKTQQMYDIINSGDATKAGIYKKVYGDCCDVPQSGCCGEASPPNP